jgi:hypothetical protein
MGAAALAALCTGLWMAAPDSGPPRALVGLFDGAWSADLPYDATPVLEVRLPTALGPAEVQTATRALEVGAARLANVVTREDEGPTKDRLVWLIPTPPDLPKSQLEALLAGPNNRLVILPVLDEGETAKAIRQFVAERPELDATSSSSPVHAPDEATLIAALEAMRDECAGCRPRAGEGLMIEPSRDGWTAMVVSRREPVFDHRYVAGSELGFNAYDGRPVAIIAFTPEGRAAFTALTRDSVGERLAIVVDGRVVSSPRIMSEITSDTLEVSTSHSADTHADALRDAQALVELLTPGIGLPTGASWRWFDLPGATGLALVLATLVTQVLAFVFGWVLARGIAWFERRGSIVGPAKPPTSADAWRTPGLASSLALRLSITAIGLVAPYIVGIIPIPILDQERIAELADPAFIFFLGAAGVTPILLAHLIVSLVVWLVPALSRLRSGSFESRRRLLLPTGVIAFAICALYAVGFLPPFLGLQLFEPGLVSTLLLVLSIAAGTALLWGAAAIVTVGGIGNGFTVLLLGGILAMLVESPRMVTDPRAIAIILLIGVVLIYATGRRLIILRPLREPTSRRLPLAGITPIDLLGTLQVVLLLVSLLSEGKLRSPQLGLWVSLVVFIAATSLIAWLVARPIAGRELRFGLVPSIAVVLTMVVGANLIAQLGPDVAPMTLTQFAALIFLPTFIVDLGAEVVGTLRHGRLARVSSTHDIDEADRLAELLASRDVAVVVRAARHRALMRFMGPWLPVELLVPYGDRRAALAFLREDAESDLVEPFGSETSA